MVVMERGCDRSDIFCLSASVNVNPNKAALLLGRVHTVRQMLFIKPIILRKDWSSSNFRVNRYTADFYTNKTEVSE